MPSRSSLTKAGWPRPIVGGWPIPWVSPPKDLSFQNGERLTKLREKKLCQVCGLGHEPGAQVFLCAAEQDDTKRDTPLDSELILLSLDDAVMHHRCAKLAIGRCPKLKSLKAQGELLVFSSTEDKIRLVWDPKNELWRLGANGTDIVITDQF